MRIGILTLPPSINYGGILQAYALQTVLTRMGHEAKVIDVEKKRPVYPLWRRVAQQAKAWVNLHMFGRYTDKLEDYDVMCAEMFRFVDKHIPKARYAGYPAIGENDFDAFVVGSDQVWRPVYVDGDIANMYLDFAKDWKHVRRVAYAASFGVGQWEYTTGETARCAALAKLFDAISVREAGAVELCRQHFGVEAVHVADPTMLLSADDYSRMIDSAGTHAPAGELACYILDRTPEKQKVIDDYAGKTGLTPYYCSTDFSNRRLPPSQRAQPSVEQWLRNIRDARYVITDSFHGTVFSIIFGRPFTVLGNSFRGMPRLRSLLATFRLEDRVWVQGKEPEAAMPDTLAVLNRIRIEADEFWKIALKSRK